MGIPLDLNILQAGADGVLPIILEAEGGAVLEVPGGDMLLDAEFVRLGPNLVLIGEDGSTVVVRGFFNLQFPPNLMTEAGAVIKADLAAKLAGPMAPGQVAQAGPGTAAEAVGTVETVEGTVTVIRADGSEVTLSKGSSVYSGDVLVTETGGAIGIVFVDDTTFSLGEEGRMVLDEMVYDPGTQEGVFKASLVQGVFSFVSGQIAKTSPDGMTVITPVATIGVRGTKVAGRSAQEGEQNTISLLPETDAEGKTVIGELTVTNQAGTVTLNQARATVQMTSAFQAPPSPVIFSPQQIQQQFGAVLTTLPPSPGGTTKDENAPTEQGQDSEDGTEAAVEGADSDEREGNEEKQAQEEDELIGGEKPEQQIVDFKPAEVFTKNAQAYKPIDFKNIFLDKALFQLPPFEFSARLTAIIENDPSVQNVVGVVGINLIFGTPGDDILIGTGIQDRIFGLAGDDILLGLLSDDFLIGGPGNDTLNGGDGNDTADYTDDTAGITVNLASGTANGSVIGSDTLISIETVRAGSGDDTITTSSSANSISGNAGDDTFIGSAGNDSYDGGTGTDTLSYANDTQGVTANLLTETASGPGIGSDTMRVENLTGGSGDDTLSGTGSANVINGGDGDDTINGDNGNDTIDGGDGTDTLNFSTFTTTVAINLSANTATGTGVGSDTLTSIENGVGGSGDDTFTGSSGANVFTGNDGDDSFVGSAGNDTLTGGSGSDKVDYTAETTALTVNLAAGTASGSGIGSDTLSSIETVRAGSGDDTITTSSSANSISGNAGDDTFIGSAGNDSYDGGTGTDTLSYANDTQGVTANLLTETASGPGIGSDTMRVENLTGGSGDDTLSGTGSANVINGGDGDDTINGDNGNDTIDGGDGTDTLNFSTFTTTVAINLSANTATGTGVGSDTLTSIENGVGGSGDDTFTGSSGANVFTGNDGDDSFVGSAGNDTLTGGSGSDKVDYTAETTALTVNLAAGTASGSGIGSDTLSSIETVRAGSGDDSITTSSSANSISGNAGDDTFIGSAGNDSYDGGTGTDTLSYANDTQGVTANLLTETASGPGIGSDTMRVENLTGGSGDDTLSGTGSANVINGGDGDDTINGDNGNDTIDGGDGTDTLNFSTFTTTVAINLSANTATGTGVGSDTLTSIENGVGGSGDDTLTGDANANVFTGAAGVDTLVGNGGSDTFRYTATTESPTTLRDVISDFNATDTAEDIFLEGLLTGTFSFIGTNTNNFSGATGGNNTEARFNDTSKLLEIDTNGDGTADMEITLTGVALADLDATDFTVT